VHDSKPRAYETPANKYRCPVGMYKEYRNRRPRGFYNSTDPFYLAVVTNKENPRNDDQWFLRGPVGKNKINNNLKNIEVYVYIECATIYCRAIKHGVEYIRGI
jgi:hypothetical protein